MVAVEQSVAAQATSIADHEAQLRQLVIGLTKSAETAARNTESCQALSVTTERLLKQQDVMNNKLDAVDSHVHNIDKRLASLEETIHTALEHSSGPSGHREEHVIQGIATKHTLENDLRMSRDGAPSRGAWAQPSGSCAAVKLWCSRTWERPAGLCDISSVVASLALPWAGRLNFSSCSSSVLQAPSSVPWPPSSAPHRRCCLDELPSGSLGCCSSHSRRRDRGSSAVVGVVWCSSC